MRRGFVFFTIALMLFVVIPVQAQGGEICSPEYMSERIEEIIAAYKTAQSNATDAAESLRNLRQMRTSLEELEELCANVATGDTTSQAHPGSGTLQDPYAFGVLGDTGQGFSLRLTGYVRPADRIIRNANMFNDVPGEGEEYVIINVELICHDDAPGRCEANALDFELTGDSGTIYSNPFVVYDDELDVSVFAGGRGEGGLPFLIRVDDTNLRLLYRPNMFSNEMVVYEAEPSLANGIAITSSTNINVRSGPGTGFPVVGNLTASSSEIAFGRNADGSWLQVSQGWVFRELVETEGDVNSLPVTAQ